RPEDEQLLFLSQLSIPLSRRLGHRRRAHKCAMNQNAPPNRCLRRPKEEDCDDRRRESCRNNSIASSRWSRVSRTRYTCTIPHAPIGARTSYGLRRVPDRAATSNLLPRNRLETHLGAFKAAVQFTTTRIGESDGSPSRALTRNFWPSAET